MPGCADVFEVKEEIMTGKPSAPGASTLWIVLLTGASMGCTALFHCMMPFAALAALAAVHMRRGDGVALMFAAWVVNQATGFLLLDYPRDPTTIMWGLGIGAAAVAAVVAGGAAAAKVGSYPLRLVAAFVTGFVAYKAVLVLCSLGLGGTDISLSPSIAGTQIVREAMIGLLLLAAYRVLVALGVPAAPAPRHALAI